SSSRGAPPGSRRPRRDPQRGYWGARPELDWIAATSLATLVFVEATSARRSDGGCRRPANVRLFVVGIAECDAESRTSRLVLPVLRLLALGGRLAGDAEPRERQKRQPAVADVLLARVADPVRSGADPGERVVDRRELVAVTVREQEPKLALTVVGGRIVDVG